MPTAGTGSPGKGTCRLTPADYRTLLSTRTTGTEITLHAEGAHIRAPRGATVVTWNGTATARHTSAGTALEALYPAPQHEDPSAGRTGAAVFTRGDRTAADWASAYNYMA